jgi:hypothetical protein
MSTRLRDAPRTQFAGPAPVAPPSADTPSASGLLLPLFLISAASVGYETALTRYFAVAKWSEYGYWVISIVMAGLALSGVAVALARPLLLRHAARVQAVLPVLLIAAAAIGYHFTAINPFNPLQLQNRATWLPQFANIGAYYAALLPFFFLTGVFISLCFVLNAGQIGRVYGFDLTGAGAGALLVLLLMLAVHPFRLVPALLLPLAAGAIVAAWRFGGRGRLALAGAAVAALVGGEALLLFGDQAQISEYKPIYAPLHVPDSRRLAELRLPRGLYALLDDFTERANTDISNDTGMLGLPGPPRSFGLYRDGNRLASLPGPAGFDVRYAGATLDALPYVLKPRARVLLAGASGGFRVAEILALGAQHVDALEPEPVLNRALRRGLAGSPPLPPDARVRILAEAPVAAAQTPGARYDVIDISADYLGESETHATAFTGEAVAAYVRALAPGGLVSVPVSIREFPAYAVRMLATARQGLLQLGLDPATHLLVYRSAWNVRILVSNEAWDSARIAAAKKFCDDRSFDISYYPGIDVAAARANIYNDLPAVSFEQGEITSGAGPNDAVADDAPKVLAGEPTDSEATFNLAPITWDRPFFYSVLRLDRLGTILKRLDILPQAEIGPLVNLAVLAQALLIAALVLLLPLLRPSRLGANAGGVARAIAYFAALGLGFLFIELWLIEKAAFYLNDRTSGFALVLTGMLIFSGLGSMLASRFAAAPRRGLALAAAVVVAWCLLLAWLAQPAMLSTLALPWGLRAAILVLVIAPVSLALGLPFPLGLGAVGRGGLLPWSWGLNGAFSVVATPLANVIALESGFTRVLLLAAGLYVLSYLAFPRLRRSLAWQDVPSPDAA